MRLKKGMQDEKSLAEKLDELVPLIEKEEGVSSVSTHSNSRAHIEEQRIQRARRKIAAAVELAQQAEFRSTRTRRTGRNVNYRYDDEGDDDDVSQARFPR